MSTETTGADMTTLLAYEAGQREAETRIVAWLVAMEAQHRVAVLATQQEWFREKYEAVADALKHARETIERGEHRARAGDDGGE